MYNNPWIYENKIFESEDIGDAIGFVYLITNKVNNKFYIGKKSLSMSKTKQIKGKKKKTRVESLWKGYYGSSPALKEDVDRLGKENFKREILHLCYSKTDLTYLELREQIDRRVLETETAYNDWIMCRVRKVNIKLKSQNLANSP